MPRTLLLFAFLSLAACGDDRPPGRTFPRDGSTADVGVPNDGSPNDSAAMDATVDGGVPSGCSLDEETGIRTLASTGVYVLDVPTLAVDDVGALVAYTVLEEGKTHAIAGYFPSVPEVDVRGFLLGDEGNRHRYPFVILSQGSFLVAFEEEVAGQSNVFARVLDARAGTQGDRIALSNDAAEDALPVIGGLSGGPFVGWVRGTGMSREGRSLRLSSSGSPGTANPIPGLGNLLGRPALAALADGALFAWVDGESRHVKVQPLTNTGAANGEVRDLSIESGASGGLDVALAPEGGAFVFDMRVAGVRPEVRFRAFDASGASVGLEKVLTRGEETGTGASITALRGGYAVAYRGASENGEASMLRVAFVDAQGELLDTLDVAPLEPPSRPVVVRASPDQTMLYIAYIDDQTLRLARIRCE